MPRLPAPEVKGLVLGIDPKKLGGTVTVDGKNFIVDADGPRSAFGYTRTYRNFKYNEFVKEITLGTKTFYFTHTADSSHCQVYTGAWTQRQFQFQLQLPTRGLTGDADKRKHPWTQALVGGIHYVAQPAFGIWAYDPVAQSWTDETAAIESAIGGSTVTYAVTQAAGRLIMLATGLVHWSAIDNGTDMLPSTVTGAGFQSLALVGTPVLDSEYKGLIAVASGFLVMTQLGIMKSTIIDSINPFRHDPLSTEYVPFNQNCVVRISTAQYVFMTATGLWVTDGNTFEVWQPLMSEYLKDKIIPNLSLNDIGQVQLHYDNIRQWFFLSYTITKITNFFTTAYALYVPRGEWGVFNQTHRAFVSVDEFGDASKLSLAFIDAGGKLCLFSDTTDNLLLEMQTATATPDLQNEVFYAEELMQPDTVTVEGIPIVGSRGRIDASDAFHNYLAEYALDMPTYAGWYELYLSTDETAGSAADDILDPAATDNYVAVQVTYSHSETEVFSFGRQGLVQESLNAFLDIGLFRITDESNSQQLTLITEASIAMTGAEGSSEAEDWLNDYTQDIIEDWLLVDDIVEDWGYAVQPASNFNLIGIGTLDGFIPYAEQETAFKLETESGGMKLFSGEVQGLYCIMRITAQQQAQSFHLKNLELTGILAGRI